MQAYTYSSDTYTYMYCINARYVKCAKCSQVHHGKQCAGRQDNAQSIRDDRRQPQASRSRKQTFKALQARMHDIRKVRRQPPPSRPLKHEPGARPLRQPLRQPLKDEHRAASAIAASVGLELAAITDVHAGGGVCEGNEMRSLAPRPVAEACVCVYV